MVLNVGPVNGATLAMPESVRRSEGLLEESPLPKRSESAWEGIVCLKLSSLPERFRSA